MDIETEEVIKREVLLLIEAKVRDRIALVVDHAVYSQLKEIVQTEVADCVGRSVGKYVTAFLRKNH